MKSTTSTSTSTDTGAPAQPPGPVDALRLLRNNRDLVLRIVGACVLLTFVFSALLLIVRPRYVAESTISLMPSRTELGFAARRGDFAGASPAGALSQTHREFLLSHTLAAEVAQELSTAGGAAPGSSITRGVRALAGSIMGVGQGLVAILNYGRWVTPEPAERLVRRLQKNVAVAIVPGSYVVRVAVTWTDPDTAAQAANLLTDRYIKLVEAGNLAELTAIRRFIDADLAETQLALQAIEDQIQAYKQAEGMYTGTKDTIIKLEELSKYQQDYSDAVVALQEKETKLQALRPYQAPATLAAEEAERAGLASRKASLEKIIAAETAVLGSYPERENALVDLYRKKAEQQANFNTLRERQMQTRVAEAAQVAAVRVIDSARPPLYPTGPKVLWNCLVAAIVGLLAAATYLLAAVFLRSLVAAGTPIPATASGGADAKAPFARRALLKLFAP